MMRFLFKVRFPIFLTQSNDTGFLGGFGNGKFRVFACFCFKLANCSTILQKKRKGNVAQVKENHPPVEFCEIIAFTNSDRASCSLKCLYKGQNPVLVGVGMAETLYFMHL